MHPLIARITEPSGPDVAAWISVEFGGQTIHLPLLACDAPRQTGALNSSQVQQIVAALEVDFPVINL